MFCSIAYNFLFLKTVHVFQCKRFSLVILWEASCESNTTAIARNSILRWKTVEVHSIILVCFLLKRKATWTLMYCRRLLSLLYHIMTNSRSENKDVTSRPMTTTLSPAAFASKEQRSEISDHYRYKLTQLCGNLIPSKLLNTIRVEGFKWEKRHGRKLAAPMTMERRARKQNKIKQQKLKCLHFMGINLAGQLPRPI